MFRTESPEPVSSPIGTATCVLSRLEPSGPEADSCKGSIEVNKFGSLRHLRDLVFDLAWRLGGGELIIQVKSPVSDTMCLIASVFGFSCKCLGLVIRDVHSLLDVTACFLD